jgi:predicted nucleotidyltransferase
MPRKASASPATTAKLPTLGRWRSAVAVELIGAEAGWRAGVPILVQNLVTDYPSQLEADHLMRLSDSERQAIAQAARDCLPPGTRVRLFGSRLDDSRRGGDIDLLVEPPFAPGAEEQVTQRTHFVARLYRLMGERRIDVLMVPAFERDTRPVVQAARRDGQLLAQVGQ